MAWEGGTLKEKPGQLQGERTPTISSTFTKSQPSVYGW
jgi:hypothetical protein